MRFHNVIVKTKMFHIIKKQIFENIYLLQYENKTLKYVDIKSTDKHV
jgi:hypothetical protein